MPRTLRFWGVVSLALYPLVSAVTFAVVRGWSSATWNWSWLLILGPLLVVLGFVSIGGSMRPRSSYLRGAVGGIGAYVAIAIGWTIFYQARFGTIHEDLFSIIYFALGWPVWVLGVLGWFGLGGD